MKLLIDDANLEKIKESFEYYPIDGVTTNPTIISKYTDKPYELLNSIKEIIKDKELHVQVISEKAEDMIKEALYIIEKLGDVYIKIPSNKEGFKAMKALYEKGVKVTATACYTPQQAYMAGKCGACYIAPYVNRIERLNGEGKGIETVKMIQNIIDTNGFEMEILGASFKKVEEILPLIEYGIGAATITPDLLETIIHSDAVDEWVKKFNTDFKQKVGQDKTMLNA